MDKDMTKKLDSVNAELRMLQGRSALNNKDSLSKLSDAIDLFRSQKNLAQQFQVEKLEDNFDKPI